MYGVPQALPQRRPAPGFDPAQDPRQVGYGEPPGPRPGRFAMAMGIPSAAAPSPRKRNVRPFDPGMLEPISKESVHLWKALELGFPPFLHGPEINKACFEFLKSLMAPAGEPGRTFTVEVKRKEDGHVELRELADAEVTIGTHASNKIQIGGASASRRHVRIVHDERGFSVVDQGSSNGTFLRGERCQPGYAYPLKNGEAFTIPGYEVHLRWAESAPAPKLLSMKASGVRIEPAARLAESVPPHALVAIVRLEPAGLRAFVEVDLPLATLAVSRVLGSVSQPAAGAALATTLKDGAPAPRPLAEVEKGVVELLFVKLLDAVQNAWGSQAELTLHLESLLDGKDPRVAQTAAGMKSCIVASIGLDFDGRRDSVRVALPDATVTTLAPLLSRSVARAGETGVEIVERFRDLTRLVSVELAGRVGRTKLTRAELAQCSPGDVFVPDQLTIGVEGSAIKGKVELAIVGGRGRTKIMADLIQFTGAQVAVQIASIEVGPQARAEARKVANPDEVQYEGEGVAQAEGGLGADDLAAAAGMDAEGAASAALLDDVPLPLIVELGRLSLTVKELASLRKGQVIELGHDPNQPVSLVFEGHVIGAGKLVNVEGEIGVQITSLGR